MQVVFKKKRRQRTKKSRKDKRPSATYVGYVAITFLSLVCGSIILFDLHTVWVNATSKKKRRLKGKYNVLGALVSRTMKTDETNLVTIIERDKYEGFSSDNNNSLKETNSRNVNQAFSFASDPVFETERNGSMTAVPVPVPRQGQLLWKQLWPGFQKAYERQDHDSGTESDVSGER